jgi:hypothetical protein
MEVENSMDDSMQTCLDALYAMNRYLATIKGRVEILLLADCPDHIKPDLATVGKAEKEISQIVRSLTLTIIQRTNQLQEGNSL